MQLSQIALLVLIAIAVVLNYIPLWLGILTAAAWIATKLVVRVIVRQIENSELKRRDPRSPRAHEEPTSANNSADKTDS